MVRLTSDEEQLGTPPASEVSLVEIAGVVARRKWLVAAVTVAAMAVTAAVVFLIPPTYTAEAVILPPQQEPSSQALLMGPLAGLSGLGGLAGAGGGSLWRNPADLYIGVLKSRTVADALIATFGLRQLYGRKNQLDTQKELARHTSITSGRDSLIRIDVDDYDRVRAASIANAYVEELHKRNATLALGSASQRRLFFEQQLAGEKKALAEAEVAFRNTQQSSGLIYPSGQSEALIRSIAQLRAEIASREVQLESMRLYAADGNPQMQLLERELTALRAQRDKLEAGSGGRDNVAVPMRQLPQAGLDQVRRLRDLKYHEALYELLAKQYEAARIDEARTAPLIQVVDTAVPPDRKSWPPRALFIAAGGLLGAILSSLAVLLRNHR